MEVDKDWVGVTVSESGVRTGVGVCQQQSDYYVSERGVRTCQQLLEQVLERVCQQHLREVLTRVNTSWKRC